MSLTLGVVEFPRLDLTRLSGTSVPFATRRLGNKPVLEWLVRRLTESLLLDQVVVITDEAQRDKVRRIVPADIGVYSSKSPDGLGQLADVVRAFRADQVVRVPLSCPFVDPELIDRLVCTAASNPSCDYIGYFSMDGRPAALSKVGFFAEWCKSDAIAKAHRSASSEEERANSLQFVVSRPDLFQLRFIPIPEKLDRRDLRLTLEAEEDWDHLHLIFEALGPERIDWRRVVALLDEHPLLLQRMESLNQGAASAVS